MIARVNNTSFFLSMIFRGTTGNPGLLIRNKAFVEEAQWPVRNLCPVKLEEHEIDSKKNAAENTINASKPMHEMKLWIFRIPNIDYDFLSLKLYNIFITSSPRA